MSGVISIEGNLGAGKSTLLSMLGVNVIKEPVDQWENVGGSNILKQYYDDPKRWAFTFQLNALHSRAKLWNHTTTNYPNTLHFSERSPLADRYIFGEIMHKQGNIDSAEYQIYDSISASLIATCPIKAIIYLRCSPQLCLERIRQRDRKGQESIPLDYLIKVHQRHEDWLGRIKNVKILTIDTGIFDIQSEKDQKEIITLMKDFIESIENEEKKCNSEKSLLKNTQIISEEKVQA